MVWYNRFVIARAILTQVAGQTPLWNLSVPLLLPNHKDNYYFPAAAAAAAAAPAHVHISLTGGQHQQQT
jgi:hypothetical protein